MTYDELRAVLPMSERIDVLREPLHARLDFPNRLAIQAMEGADGTPDGAPDELTVRRYDRFAASGAGLLWFEATAVRHDGRANPRQLYLHADNADTFKRLVVRMRETAFKANGIAPVIVMQATHSGRYSKPDGVFAPMNACNNPIFEGDNPLPPERIISDDMLRRIEEDYAKITKLAVDCGFDGIDIKACHRYLNNELLSAFTRPGPYGGPLENRMRFFRNCVENARTVAPSYFLVTSRMNIYDGIPYPYGFGVSKDSESVDFRAQINATRTVDADTVAPDLTDPIEVLHQLNFPIINITMGNPYFNPQVNRPVDVRGVERMYALTKQIKAACPDTAVISSAPTFVRELSPHLAAGAVEQCYADIVGYGRMAFAYPDFARDTLSGCFDRKRACLACGKCTELMRASKAGCAVRDPVYTALYKDLLEERKRV